MSDEAVHYMESTSRLRAENEELRQQLGRLERSHARMDRLYNATNGLRLEAEATMREVAEELRKLAKQGVIGYHTSLVLADRLDPPPVVENPPA